MVGLQRGDAGRRAGPGDQRLERRRRTLIGADLVDARAVLGLSAGHLVGLVTLALRPRASVSARVRETPAWDDEQASRVTPPSLLQLVRSEYAADGQSGARIWFRAVVSPTGPGVAALERACLLPAVVAAAPTLAEADVRPLDSAAENTTVDE
jgi:hypothetical protein